MAERAHRRPASETRHDRGRNMDRIEALLMVAAVSLTATMAFYMMHVSF